MNRQKLLPQTRAVSNLIDNVFSVLDKIPECEEKQELVKSIEAFSTELTLTTWNVQDIFHEFPEATPDDCRKTLEKMFEDYVTSPYDWENIHSCYEDIIKLQEDAL